MNVDFAMQEVLTVIIILLIVGVVLDGVRRMRQSRRDSIKMSRSMGQGMDGGGDEAYGSELPNGGARISRRDPDQAESLNQEVRRPFPLPDKEAHKIPEQVALNLEEQVPMLMDSVDSASARVEPVLDETQSEQSLLESAAVEHGDPSRSMENQVADASSADPEEVIIINVMAPQGYRFQGEDLLQVLLENGMRFGTMNIFHRHLEADGQGEILFSMANMVVPGTFDLDEMSSFETPGVSFFLTLPINADSLQAFETMVQTTAALCNELGGELKDENRSVMTQQTIEHCRQRVKEFSRKQLSRK